MAVLSRRPLVRLAKAKGVWARRNGGGKRRFAQLVGGGGQQGGGDYPASGFERGDPPASGFERGDPPASSFKQREHTKMSDFHYFNIYLLGGSDFVKLTSFYSFCENKNMYACILLHLSTVYESIPVRDIMKVLKNILQQNKASFSHPLVKGKRITHLYKHMCQHLDKLNTAEVISLLTCACYTTKAFPVESVRMLCRVILAKPLGCFHPTQIHEICSCLIKMKTEFSLRKLPYDDALHVKMREHHALSLDTKYVVRFWRKCHSLRFEKGGRRGDMDGAKRTVSSDETLRFRSTRGGVITTLGEDHPMDYPVTLKTGEVLSEERPHLGGTTTQGEGEEEEGSNVLLSFINSKVYHMTPPQLSRVTYGLYSFVENMKQYSQLSSLRNNMNFLFSMAVQYVLNYLDRGALHQDEIPPSSDSIRKKATADVVLSSEGDHSSYISMNTDYLYISSSGVHIRRGDRGGVDLPSDNCAGDGLPTKGCPPKGCPPKGCPPSGSSPRRGNLTHACDILLNISYLNTSQNHRKIKDAYDCVKKIITQEAEEEEEEDHSSVELDNLLSLLLSMSNFYHRTRDNYVFHSYKQILHMLERKKLKFNTNHFNKISIAITPLLQEKNNLIAGYAHLICFFIENEVVPLRSCVFTLQHIMKKICVKLSDPLVTLLLVIIRRIDRFLCDVRAHIARSGVDDGGDQDSRDDLHDSDSPDSSANRDAHRRFLLLHSINESTLTCVLVSLSLILQNAKYGTGARDEAAALLRRMVSYVSTGSLEKIPKKYIHAGLLDALPPDDNRVKKVLLSRA
ncbi:hypothetical protein PCYB_011840 [Plasmodium cynomolgi strain B]|uniref:Uncharacterized protein n=1 Tax=Plasmodium cynomolgi (strain B) TaxID=1120755 RepID=K6UC93_PLACD|nr:hypothetical protein PCYB_011840 [Plasmodium cynomolgi strain B]GAB64451.1 hypothetical protein PCYB_011840 [Plasmodium cynomolgi strain B]